MRPRHRATVHLYRIPNTAETRLATTRERETGETDETEWGPKTTAAFPPGDVPSMQSRTAFRSFAVRDAKKLLWSNLLGQIEKFWRGGKSVSLKEMKMCTLGLKSSCSHLYPFVQKPLKQEAGILLCLVLIGSEPSQSFIDRSSVSVNVPPSSHVAQHHELILSACGTAHHLRHSSISQLLSLSARRSFPSSIMPWSLAFLSFVNFVIINYHHYHRENYTRSCSSKTDGKAFS